jgi:hypothetical protein
MTSGGALVTSSTGIRVTSRPREQWADNLRVVVVAGVIVAHTATGYLSDIAHWPYEELTSSVLWGTVLTFPAAAGALFGLGPLFLLAGWFSVRSLQHRGPVGFAGSRLVRLGLPVAAYALLVNPLANTVSDLPFADAHGFGYYVRIPEFGVMWFVVALLAFSLVYAALRQARPARPAGRTVSLGTLLVAAGAMIAVASYAVWQLWPWNSNALLGARLGEWPQGAVLFALGVHAGENGWLDDVPRSVSSRLTWVAGLGTVLTFGLFGVLEAVGTSEGVLNQASGPGTLLFAVLDGTVAVSLTLWFILWVRRRWPTHGPVLDKGARGSYATYLLHPLVLTTIMVILAPVPLPPELKFVVVSLLGVTACFTVGYAMTRVPGVSKIL